MTTHYTPLTSCVPIYGLYFLERYTRRRVARSSLALALCNSVEVLVPSPGVGQRGVDDKYTLVCGEPHRWNLCHIKGSSPRGGTRHTVGDDEYDYYAARRNVPGSVEHYDNGINTNLLSRHPPALAQPMGYSCLLLFFAPTCPRTLCAVAVHGHTLCASCNALFLQLLGRRTVCSHDVHARIW